MIRHIFLDKTATILKGLKVNTGLNPVAELNYGDVVTRFLIHFDDTEIAKMCDEKVICNQDKVKFTLKMTNAAGIDGVPYDKPLKFGNTCIEKQRAVSFTILALKLPCKFDAGRGFEYVDDVWIGKNKSYSRDACNWFQAYNGKAWPEEGVYSPARIKEEYENFMNGEESVVVSRQHFDFGDEQLSLDLTDYVKKVIAGEEPNNGILVCFTPRFEVLNGGSEFVELSVEPEIDEITEYSVLPSTNDVTIPEFFKVVKDIESGETETKYYKRVIKDVQQQYVGFFTNNTNTFFHPYLEVSYDECVKDDRECFYPGKLNRLYLYANIGGKPENLDELPTCSFGGVDCEVKQATKGVYYAEILLADYEPNTIVEDVWTNLKYKGVEQEDVELETVVLPRSEYFQIGNRQVSGDNLVPSVYGINDDEGVKKGDVREIVVDFRKKYTTNERQTVTDAYYRLYVMDGNREIDILNGYQPIERTYLQNYFMIYTEDLIPNNRYYVDVKIKSGREEKFFKDVLHFRVVDDVTERYA